MLFVLFYFSFALDLTPKNILNQLDYEEKDRLFFSLDHGDLSEYSQFPPVHPVSTDIDLCQSVFTCPVRSHLRDATKTSDARVSLDRTRSVGSSVILSLPRCFWDDQTSRSSAGLSSRSSESESDIRPTVPTRCSQSFLPNWIGLSCPTLVHQPSTGLFLRSVILVFLVASTDSRTFTFDTFPVSISSRSSCANIPLPAIGTRSSRLRSLALATNTHRTSRASGGSETVLGDGAIEHLSFFISTRTLYNSLSCSGPDRSRVLFHSLSDLHRISFYLCAVFHLYDVLLDHHRFVLVESNEQDGLFDQRGVNVCFLYFKIH